jgi:translocation and assembly module TamB
MSWKTTIRKTGKWAALTLAALFLLVATVFGVAQTDPGKRQLVKLIARTLVPGDENRIEFGKLSGLIPFTFELDSLTLSDANGPWMTAERLVLRWSPFALLRKKIVIQEFSGHRVSLDRIPMARAAATGPLIKKLPTWPSTLFGLRVDRFVIRQFALGDALVGQAALFKMEAKVRADSTGDIQESHISVERLDGPKMGLQIHAMLHHEGALLTLDGSLEEAQNGLVATALGIPGPLALSIQGEGPIRDWKGIFRADFPHVGQCESQIQIEAGKPFVMNAQGTLSFRPGFLPEPMALWVARDPNFSVSARFPKPALLDLERMTVETGNVALHLAGSWDLKRNRSNARFTLFCDDLKPLSTLAKVPSAGRFEAEGSLSGPLFQPEADVHFMAWDSVFQRLSFSNLDGTLFVKLLEPLSSALPKFRVRGKGMLKGVTLQGWTLPPQKEIQWQLDMENPGEDVFLIKESKAKTEGMDIALTGRINPSASKGELDVLLDVAEPSAVASVFGLDLPETGRTSLSTSLKGNLDKGSFTAQFRGKTQILDQRLVPVLGEQIEYRGHIALEERKRLMLSDFIAETSLGTLTGKGAYDLRGKTVNASWTMNVPQLVALSPILKHPMEGSVEMEGTLEGPPSEISLSVQATAENFFIEGFRLGEATATLRAHGFPPKSEGRCSVQVRPKGQPIGAKASYALQGENLALNNILLEGASTELAGTATLDISRMLSEGQFKGRSDNLSVLSALFGKKMEGRASGTVRFNFGKSDQQITLELEGQNLKTSLVEAQQASLQGRIEELFKLPKGSATLEVKHGRFRELFLSSLRVKAEGNLNQIAFSTSAKGRCKEILELEGSGLFASSPRGQMITLNHLKAQYGEFPLDLAEPVQILRSDTAVAIDPFAIKIGSGVLQGMGNLGKNALALDLAFREMSLKASKYFGFTSLTGTAGGALLLKGTPRQPSGHLALHIENLGLDNPHFADLPPGILEVKGELDRQRIRGEASLQRLTAEPFKATLDVPVNLSFSPFAFSLPQQEKIKGSLDGEIDLAHIVSLFGLDDQKMTGRMDFDLSLGGDAKKPRMKGKVILNKGTYENLRSGTILTDMDVEITASIPRLKIERARATDGEKGIVTAQGWFDILPSEGYPFQIGLTLEHAKPFRHDAAFATAGGQLTLEGSLVEPALKGKILVESAEFRIPERLPPEITDLEIIEINREGRAREPSRERDVPKNDVLKLNISLLSSGRAFVRGRGLDSEWEGELKVTGTAGEPRLIGKLGIVRGHFKFLGKRFDLTRGLISFQGATPPSPLLDVLGEAHTKNITARIELSGSLQSPELKLNSEPSLPTDEILSRLLFGRSVAGITPLQAVQLASAVNTLAGGGGMDFMGRTREVLKLDQLEIKQTGSKPEEATVSAGKYLSDTVFLEVEQGLGPDSGKASVQWEMTPNISLETEAGVNAEGGAGISWKWDY